VPATGLSWNITTDNFAISWHWFVFLIQGSNVHFERFLPNSLLLLLVETSFSVCPSVLNNIFFYQMPQYTNKLYSYLLAAKRTLSKCFIVVLKERVVPFFLSIAKLAFGSHVNRAYLFFYWQTSPVSCECRWQQKGQMCQEWRPFGVVASTLIMGTAPGGPICLPMGMLPMVMGGIQIGFPFWLMWCAYFIVELNAYLCPASLKFSVVHCPFVVGDRWPSDSLSGLTVVTGLAVRSMCVMYLSAVCQKCSFLYLAYLRSVVSN
jgi:hypothetical protein